MGQRIGSNRKLLSCEAANVASKAVTSATPLSRSIRNDSNAVYCEQQPHLCRPRASICYEREQISCAAKASPSPLQQWTRENAFLGLIFKLQSTGGDNAGQRFEPGPVKLCRDSKKCHPSANAVPGMARHPELAGG